MHLIKYVIICLWIRAWIHVLFTYRELQPYIRYINKLLFH